MRTDKKHIVKKIRFNRGYKNVVLGNGQELVLPSSSCVDKNCMVFEHNSDLFIDCKNGKTKISPVYCVEDEIKVEGLSLEIVVKEITDEHEYLSYLNLAQYHYKEKNLFGRTSILVAINNTPYLPKVIGYIELATPFYVNKPRAEALNSRFQHNGVNWELWDKETTKKYINVIARIARCVVYPEFRGMGLGRKLVEHAEDFAREKWQISGLKPLFMEISADMLKYVPFAEKAGMHYVGETQGNLNRIHKDLAYLLKNHKRVRAKEIVGNHQMGIVEQQKSRLRKAIKLADENGLSIEEFISRLEKLQKDQRLVDFTFFNGLVSLPKPTYLKGLDEIAESFLIDQLKENNIEEDKFYSQLNVEKLSGPIELENIDVSFNTQIRRTHKAQAIQNAFGISPSDIKSPIIKGLNLTIKPGEIVLVIGSSGAGKTTLLNLLSESLNGTSVEVKGKCRFPNNYTPGVFSEIRSKKALIEYFAKEKLDYSIQLLGSVGLSDAFVFVKRYDELSNGQKYRTQLAKLIHSGNNTLIVDEFCANLDPITSNVLANRIRKLSRKLGLTIIVGAAHCDNFVRSLMPDKVVRLSTAWDYEVLKGVDFYNEYKSKQYPLNYSNVSLNDLWFEKISTSKISSLILDRTINLQNGFHLAVNGNRKIPIYISEVSELIYENLKLEHAQKCGFRTLKEFKQALFNEFNGQKDILYLVDFKMVNFKNE